jgi:hypothetical protein
MTNTIYAYAEHQTDSTCFMSNEIMNANFGMRRSGPKITLLSSMLLSYF